MPNETLETHPLAGLDLETEEREEDGRPRAPATLVLDWRQMLGWGLIAFGFIALIVGWFQVSGETEVWKQLPYVMSAGLVGAALVAVGAVVLVSFDHWRDRQVLRELFSRLDRIELALGGEFEDLRSVLEDQRPDGHTR